MRLCLKREISGLRVSEAKEFQLKPKLAEERCAGHSLMAGCGDVCGWWVYTVGTAEMGRCSSFH